MNPSVGQASFEVKRKAYENSIFASAREVAKVEVGTLMLYDNAPRKSLRGRLNGGLFSPARPEAVASSSGSKPSTGHLGPNSPARMVPSSPSAAASQKIR